MDVCKVELMIIDFDYMGAGDIKDTLENTKYPNHCFNGLSVMSVIAKDIGEWSDEHPLNQTGSHEDEYRRLFGDPKADAMVDEKQKIIDRLTAELARLKDELTCEECEESLVNLETCVTAICIPCWNAVVTKLRAEIDKLTAELKAKDKEIERLAANQFPAEPICGGILWETHLKPCKR